MDEKNESNPFKIYKLGDEELKHRTNLKGKYLETYQDYETLKAQYKEKGRNFKDDEFPITTENKSFEDFRFCKKLRYDANVLYKTFGEFEGLEWGRVKDLIAKETIITNNDTAERLNDHTLTFFNGNFQDSVPHIKHGLIESGWFITAITAVADMNSSECIDEIVPKDNLNDDGTGVYHFRFWYQGCKVDVVVDDYVPFLRSEQGIVLIGAPPLKLANNILEFWICLAEKAFAKLLAKGYETLGTEISAFSGLEFMGCGFLQILDLGQLEDFDVPLDCYDQLAETFTKDQSVITLDCGPKYRYTQEFISQDGLVSGLTYLLKGVYEITNPQIVGPSKEKVVKIRCPGGGNKSMKWKGEWSAHYEPKKGGNFWDKISPEEKKSVGYDENADDIFWMSYDNMLRYFRRIDVCLYITAQKLAELESQNTRLLIVHGEFGLNDAHYELNVGESPKFPNVGIVILGFCFKMELHEKPSPVDLKVYKVNNPPTEKTTKSSILNVLIGAIMKSLESIVCYPCQATNKIETVPPVEIKPIDGSTKQLELGYKSLSFGYKIQELGKHKIIISYKNNRSCNQTFVLKVIYTRPKKEESSANGPQNLPEKIRSGTAESTRKEHLSETIPKSQESTEHQKSKDLENNATNVVPS